jgi:hypothetical protein
MLYTCFVAEFWNLGCMFHVYLCVITVVPASSPCSPRSKPNPDGHLRQSRRVRRRSPLFAVAAGASTTARAALAPRSHPIKIRRPRSDPDQGQITRYRSTLGSFAL